MTSQPNPIQTTLRNHWNNDVAFRVQAIGTGDLHRPHFLPTYTIVWIQGGKGKVHDDFSCFLVNSGTMLFFSPYRPFTLESESGLEGFFYHFSNEFFCLENHRHEVACNGVLFDNLYAPPCLEISPGEKEIFGDLTMQILAAFASPHDFAREDILKSYLKIFLVHASRICLSQAEARSAGSAEPVALKQFRVYLEQHYLAVRTPSGYAEMLNLSLSALGKLTKRHYGKAPSSLIAEKRIIEAKRQLYLTEKSVKEIAYELGFEDQHYFSRFFKKHAGIPAEEYRRRVGTVASLFG